MQDPYIGSVLDGRYEILAKIGEGGMGVVYKARQVSIDRVIAIKVLNPQMANDQQWVQRFSNEARACSRLQHPNTIKMFDFGQTQDGRFFMTMEFLDGQVLRQAIQNSSPMQPARVMRILVQCCASLAEAHSIGIIHRDIKPDNVFLLNMPGSPDFVKLLDFSVAKLLAEGSGGMKTQAGVVFGTPQYMSPEQGRGMPLDARSDLYALGVLGYEMLTGNVPFNDDNPMAVLQMHLRSEVPPLPAGLPPSVVAIVKKALDKDPGRRFQSAGEMMQTCQQVLTELNAGAAAQQGPPPQAQGGPQKTMMAPMPGMGPGLPGMPPPVGGGGPPPPAAYAPQQAPQQAAGGAQKTMMAPMPAGMGGPPPAAGPPQARPGPGGYVQADHAQKTMIAGMSPFAPGGSMAGVNPAGPGATAAAMAQMGQQPGMQQPGMQQPGMQPGMSQPNMQPGMPGMPGMRPPGMGGPMGQGGMGQGGMGQPGMGQGGMGQGGMGQPGMGQGGMGQGGMGQPGMGQPGMGQGGMGQPGMGQPGMGQGGMGQGGMGQPGMGQPGMGQGGSPPKTMMLQNTEGVVSVAARGGGMVPGVAGGGMPALGGPVPGVGGPMPGMGGMQQPSSGASGAFWAVSLLVGALGGALAYAIVRAL